MGECLLLFQWKLCLGNSQVWEIVKSVYGCTNIYFSDCLVYVNQDDCVTEIRVIALYTMLEFQSGTGKNWTWHFSLSNIVLKTTYLMDLCSDFTTYLNLTLLTNKEYKGYIFGLDWEKIVTRWEVCKTKFEGFSLEQLVIFKALRMWESQKFLTHL